MGEHSLTRLWMMRIIFVLLAMLILFLHLLPMNLQPSLWTLPNMLMGFAYAWAVRRPEYVPIALLAAVLLLADFLQQRPPGLWAALVLIGAETLKTRANALSVATFWAEWLRVAALIVATTLLYRTVLALLLVDVPGLALVLIQMSATVLCYPIFVFITHAILNVRKSVPGEIERMGRRI